MNSRIDSLIEQCTIQQFSDCVGGYETFDRERFAELIVRECQLRVEQYINECGEVASMPDTVIMKHFGIEP